MYKFDWHKMVTSWQKLGYPLLGKWTIHDHQTLPYCLYNTFSWTYKTQVLWGSVFLPLQISTKVLSINLWYSLGTHDYVYQTESIFHHWILLPMASLMQDAMKTTSSQITFLFKFHMNALYMITLSCLMYKMNSNNCSFGVNLVGCLVAIWASLMDFAWAWMVGTLMLLIHRMLTN